MRSTHPSYTRLLTYNHLNRPHISNPKNKTLQELEDPLTMVVVSNRSSIAILLCVRRSPPHGHNILISDLLNGLISDLSRHILHHHRSHVLVLHHRHNTSLHSHWSAWSPPSLPSASASAHSASIACPTPRSRKKIFWSLLRSFADSLFSAICNVRVSLVKDLGVHEISVSSTFAFADVITTPFPPFVAQFQELRLKTVIQTRSSISKRDEFSVLFYPNRTIPLVVIETGWPSSSTYPNEGNANPVYAEMYLKGLGHLNVGRAQEPNSSGAINDDLGAGFNEALHGHATEDEHSSEVDVDASENELDSKECEEPSGSSIADRQQKTQVIPKGGQ
ncbi:hypothetical protein M0R45_005619 [Rubus argutus]|uniref:Uncharacterized protein n=1 Tax=Rubus argutus TaxID=59490 RepID=A0AAW1YN71_RUBAR